MPIKIGRDILDPAAAVFAIADHVKDLGNGQVAFAVDPQETHFWNEIGSYGVFHNDATSINAFERFRRQPGNIIASWGGNFYTFGEF